MLPIHAALIEATIPGERMFFGDMVLNTNSSRTKKPPAYTKDRKVARKMGLGGSKLCAVSTHNVQVTNVHTPNVRPIKSLTSDLAALLKTVVANFEGSTYPIATDNRRSPATAYSQIAKYSIFALLLRLNSGQSSFFFQTFTYSHASIFSIAHSPCVPRRAVLVCTWYVFAYSRLRLIVCRKLGTVRREPCLHSHSHSHSHSYGHSRSHTVTQSHGPAVTQSHSHTGGKATVTVTHSSVTGTQSSQSLSQSSHSSLSSLAQYSRTVITLLLQYRVSHVVRCVLRGGCVLLLSFRCCRCVVVALDSR